MVHHKIESHIIIIYDNIYKYGWYFARLVFNQAQIIFAQKITYDVILFLSFFFYLICLTTVMSLGMGTLCVVQIGRWPSPPREWDGTSHVWRAQPTDYHLTSQARPSGYHLLFLPDPRADHGLFMPDPRNSTIFLCPTTGIALFFPLKKVMSRPIPGGGMVNHRFEPHITAYEKKFYGKISNFSIFETVSENP